MLSDRVRRAPSRPYSHDPFKPKASIDRVASLECFFLNLLRSRIELTVPSVCRIGVGDARIGERERERERARRREGEREREREWAVDPLGTVVASRHRRSDSVVETEVEVETDPDPHTLANGDEAGFRPVLAAVAAPASAATDMPLRPLPRATTLPVQPSHHATAATPTAEAAELADHTVIPAALAALAAPAIGDIELPRIRSPPKSCNANSDDIRPGVGGVAFETPPTAVFVRSSNDVDVDVAIDRPTSDRDRVEASTGSPSRRDERRAIEERISRRDVDDGRTDASARVKGRVRDVDDCENRKCDVDDMKTDATRDTRRDKSTHGESENCRFENIKPDLEVSCAVRNRATTEKRQKNKRVSDVDEGKKKADRVKKFPMDNMKTDFNSSVQNVRAVIKEEAQTFENKKETEEEKNTPKDGTQNCKVENIKTDFNIDFDVLKEAAKDKPRKSKTEKLLETEERKKNIKDKEQKRIDDFYNYGRDIKFEPPNLLEEKLHKFGIENTSKTFFSNESECTMDKPQKQKKCFDIKTEDQAWDMLLSEHEKKVSTIDVNQPIEKNLDDRPKSKKNRKSKSKPYDDRINKAEDDSFVEIHNISDNKSNLMSDIVSISTGFEESDPFNVYLSKTKQIRQAKSLTPERKFGDNKTDKRIEKSREFTSDICFDKTKLNMTENISFGDELFVQPKSDYISNMKSNVPSIDVVNDSNFLVTKDSSNKSRKVKSVSPFYDSKKLPRDKLVDVTRDFPPESEDDKIIVIDSTKDEFPEIQITRTSKTRQKTPQTFDVKIQDVEVPDRPVKSWSSIAASKSERKTTEEQIKKDCGAHFEDISLSEFTSSSKETSLQEKLIELCKRPDVMVAQCDAPSTDCDLPPTLNFVEEHHSVLQDLPPLEPLNFALDDFKLEVMRDSLLDSNDTKVVSPICTINIDDILSSIKDTTARAVESSMFNYVAMENVPMSNKDGFNVVKSDRITTQSIDIKEGEFKLKKEFDVTEKLSDIDDENTFTSQTDSEKDEKRTTEAIAAQSSLSKSKAKKSKKKRK